MCATHLVLLMHDAVCNPPRFAVLQHVQSEELRRLRGVQDLSQLPDMKELQRMASRDDAHVLLQATNAPIQSTSADAMKAALVELHTRLSQPPDSCRLLLTVSL